jgi:2-amino-4-hydroxy-6-hydroxymethyldihydropteridine diphosphokinase
MSTLALIGLGSNLGDRCAILDGAITALAETSGISVRAVSTYHETAPVGGPAGQGAFLNAAAALETTLDPFAVARRLHEIEQIAGRVRVVRWGERTLDMDLLLFGDEIIDTPELVVPHLGMAVRGFVLAPLAEIAPDAIDPMSRRNIAELLLNVERRPSYVAVPNAPPRVFRRLAEALSAAGLSQGCPDDTSARESLSKGPDSNVAISRTRSQQWTCELRSDRWSEALWGDRWIMTDFWFDTLYFQELENEDASALRDSRLRLERQRRDVVQPTFIVFTGSATDDFLPTSPLPAWAARYHPHDPFGCDAPILRLRSTELNRLRLELANACRGDEEKATELSAQLDDACVHEILSACAATRSGR